MITVRGAEISGPLVTFLRLIRRFPSQFFTVTFFILT